MWTIKNNWVLMHFQLVQVLIRVKTKDNTFLRQQHEYGVFEDTFSISVIH